MDTKNQSLGIILITAISGHENPARIEEYNTCLSYNCENHHIGRIIIFFEGDEEASSIVISHPKIQILYIKHRAILNKLMDHGSQHFPGSYILVCNADIYFDKCSCLHRVPEMRPDGMWALARHHQVDGSWILEFPPHWGSYDSYIFKAPLKPIDLPLDLEVGRAGCDSYLVARAVMSGIPVANPSLTIISKHVHAVPDRSHTWRSEQTGEKISYQDLDDYQAVMRIAHSCSLDEVSYLT